VIEGIEFINTGIGTEYGQWPHKMGLEPTFLRDGYFWNGGKSWYAHDWGSSGGVREKYSVYPIGDGEKQKAKKGCPKRRGPRWDSNPRGYEQEIGPNHLRKGRHEPSSYACDRGHRGYKHWDRIWAMAPQDGI